MGLDTVETVIGWERAFGIRIEDDTAALLHTPRQAMEMIACRVPLSLREGGLCFSARVFFRLRDAASGLPGMPRITPATDLVRLFPAKERKNSWHLLRQRMNAPDFPRPGICAALHCSPRTARDITQWLISKCPSAFTQEPDRWSHGEIRAVVRNVIAAVIGHSRFRDDDHFIRDIGMD